MRKRREGGEDRKYERRDGKKTGDKKEKIERGQEMRSRCGVPKVKSRGI